jgi:hypothetical protein
MSLRASRGPRRLLSATAVLAVLAAAPASPTLATAAAQPTTSSTAPGCPAGTESESAAAGNGAGAGFAGLPGEPDTCRRLGHVESPAETTQMQREASAPWTAGSGPVPAGAYAAALAARQAMVGAAAGGGNAWALLGKGPLSAAGNFDQVGTTGQYINALGFRNLGGRVTDLAYDPTTPGRVFASAAEGGVWESRNGGTSWTSIGNGLITQSVGAIAWDPLAGGTLVVGTGDNAQGRYNYGGHGVYFTRDGGASWVAASPNVLDNTEVFRVAISGNDNHRLYVATSRGLYQGTFNGPGTALSLANVHLPTGRNPATTGPDCGTDAGAAVFPNCFLANNVTDVQVLAPGGVNPVQGSATGDEVIATVGSRFGNHLYETPDGSGSLNFKQTPTAGIYRSMTGAPGSFTHLAPSGYPTSDHVGRVSLNAARGPAQDHRVVYALVHDPTKEDHCFDDFDLPAQCHNALPTPIVPTPAANLSTVLDGMYYSADFGSSWTKVMDWSQLDQLGTNSAIGGPGGQDAVGYGPGIQSNYNNWVLIDPTKADASGKPTRLLFGLEEIWENNPSFVSPFGNPATNDWVLTQKAFEGAGTNDPWKVIGRYWNSCGPFTFGQGFNCNGTEATLGGTTTHPDQHAAMMIPSAGGVTLYAGSDGGLFKQTANAAHPQFDNESWGDGTSGNMNTLMPYDAEMSKDGTVTAGLQDNGNMMITPAGQMLQDFGGDGFYSAIDPNDSKKMVEEYVYGRTAFTTDGGVTWTGRDPGLASCTGCARFDTPFQLDPTNSKNFLIAGRIVYNRSSGFSGSNPSGNDWDQVYDLGTGQHPGDGSQSTSPAIPDANNSSTAVDLRGEAEYVGFCAQCDLLLEGNPFSNGIATNVGGGTPGRFGDPAGWHIAAMRCSNCKTASGAPMNRIPRRYITSVRIDPADKNTIYVTMGGYQRVWVNPGAFGEANPYIGQGHVFKSTNHGEDFRDISANLPNTPALFSLVHAGHLVVSTDMGVFQSSDTNGGDFGVLGTNLPATPVDTIRLAPGNPDLVVAALWGRGVWTYCFTGAHCPASVNAAGPAPTVTSVIDHLPDTAAGLAAGPAATLLLVLLVAGTLGWRRRRA